MRERERQAEAEGFGSSTLNVLLSNNNLLICLSSSHFLTVQPLQDRTKKGGSGEARKEQKVLNQDIG